VKMTANSGNEGNNMESFLLGSSESGNRLLSSDKFVLTIPTFYVSF